MANRLEEFVRQAKAARERADAAEGEIRIQWIRVAEMWEQLAKEYKAFRQLLEAAKADIRDQ